MLIDRIPILIGYDPPRTPEGCSCPCHVGPERPEPPQKAMRCCLHKPLYEDHAVVRCPHCGKEIAI